MSDPTAAQEAPSSARPARAGRSRRQMPASTKRLLLVIAGLLVLAASVAGFYLTSDAFDERSAVLVAARGIEPGETVGAADFGSDLALAGSIPHIPFTAGAPVAFEGMVAAQPIPAGALVRFDMFIEGDAVPVGVELELTVPLDLSLATGELSEDDEVLLVDPGADPADGDDGRPRRVVRSFRLTNFDGSQMRLFLAPEEWAEWTAALAGVGGTFMVVDLGLGAEADEMRGRLDAVWRDQWSDAVQEAALQAAAVEAEPTAGPGELEVIVSLDAGLAPSGVGEGDLVLLIDPGAEPLGNDPGRPRSVIGTLELDNYADGQMRMFVPPEEWLYWRSLPGDLGAAPMVLPVAEGTDTDDMAARLDAEWRTVWERSVAEAGSAG